VIFLECNSIITHWKIKMNCNFFGKGFLLDKEARGRIDLKRVICPVCQEIRGLIGKCRKQGFSETQESVGIPGRKIFPEVLESLPRHDR
jgi:hypothetical protein